MTVEELILKQIENLFWLTEEDITIIKRYMQEASQRARYSFSFNKNKYYSGEKCGDISPLHTAQYNMFLYYLANTIYRNNPQNNIVQETCDKIYGVSKTLISADLFYAVNLPDIFTCDHPHGAVMGRACYGQYFSFSQGCTVGNNRGIYPSFSDHVAMLSDSKVIGKCHIGSNVIISANTYIKDTDIPSNSIVFGQSPNLKILSKRELIQEYMESIWR